MILWLLGLPNPNGRNIGTWTRNAIVRTLDGAVSFKFKMADDRQPPSGEFYEDDLFSSAIEVILFLRNCSTGFEFLCFRFGLFLCELTAKID